MRAPRPDEFDMTPEISDIDTITDEVAKMEHIVVLTGFLVFENKKFTFQIK